MSDTPQKATASFCRERFRLQQLTCGFQKVSCVITLRMRAGLDIEKFLFNLSTQRSEGAGSPGGIPIAFLKPFPAFWNSLTRSDKGFRRQPSALWRSFASRLPGREGWRFDLHQGFWAVARGVFAQAFRRPALTRSAIRLRSNSATAPRTVNALQTWPERESGWTA